MTLLNKLLQWRVDHGYKREFANPEANAEREINALTNFEFLEELSVALDEILKKGATE